MRVRILNDFIEINYERVAKLLPGHDRRDIEDEIMGLELAEERYSEGYDYGHSCGYDEGEEWGREKERERILSVLDDLMDDDEITEAQLELIESAV